MGWNGDRCINQTVCQAAIDRTIPQDPDPDLSPDDSDELCEDNPNVTWACYWDQNPYWNMRTINPVTGWFWMVKRDAPHTRPLAPGYAEAVPVDLPVRLESGQMVVIRDREVVADDGPSLGHYAIAQTNPNFWLEIDRSPITLIEWLDVNDVSTIRTIHTTSEAYSCRVRKDGQLLLCDDADAIEYDYWLAPSTRMPRTYGDRHRAVDLPLTDELKKLIQSAISVGTSMYCTICDDETYEDDASISECGHLRYLHSIETWGGCGSIEDDLTTEYTNAFQLLVQALEDGDSVERTIRLLQNRKFRELLWLTHRYWTERDFEPALKYLASLDENVPPSYFDQAIAWLTAPIPTETAPHETHT